MPMSISSLCLFVLVSVCQLYNDWAAIYMRDHKWLCRSMVETETRRLQVSRRDRDVEMHVVINAVVNKLTSAFITRPTVATVTACPLISWCIPDCCVGLFNSSDYVQTVFMPRQPVGTGR